MRECRVKLIGLYTPLDEDGNPVTDLVGNPIVKEQVTEIFAELGKAGQKEFFAAAQAGLKSEGMIVVWSCEYEGQSIIELDGTRYDIYRTYGPRADEKTELYFQRRKGASG